MKDDRNGRGILDQSKFSKQPVSSQSHNTKYLFVKEIELQVYLENIVPIS